MYAENSRILCERSRVQSSFIEWTLAVCFVGSSARARGAQYSAIKGTLGNSLDLPQPGMILIGTPNQKFYLIKTVSFYHGQILLVKTWRKQKTESNYLKKQRSYECLKLNKVRKYCDNFRNLMKPIFWASIFKYFHE